jgi:hypothetical protein
MKKVADRQRDFLNERQKEIGIERGPSFLSVHLANNIIEIFPRDL